MWLALSERRVVRHLGTAIDPPSFISYYPAAILVVRAVKIGNLLPKQSDSLLVRDVSTSRRNWRSTMT
jgi:hypothetical protein